MNINERAKQALDAFKGLPVIINVKADGTLLVRLSNVLKIEAEHDPKLARLLFDDALESGEPQVVFS